MARNAASNLSSTLDSLIQQTSRPLRIVVVNDGSTDSTGDILGEISREHPIIQVLNRPDQGYDIRRVPSNINLAIAASSDLRTDYVMISGDDCTYPTDYAESIIRRMVANTKIVVASGRPSQLGIVLEEHSPSGSGRMIRASFLRQVGNMFPVRAGWEAWLLFTAAQKGLETKSYGDLTYAHVRPRGTGHQFTRWGAAMYTLGYHPLYALGRIARNLVKLTSLRSSLALFTGYLTASLGSADSFNLPFNSSLRRFVSEQQALEIRRVVSQTISHGID